MWPSIGEALLGNVCTSYAACSLLEVREHAGERSEAVQQKRKQKNPKKQLVGEDRMESRGRRGKNEQEPWACCGRELDLEAIQQPIVRGASTVHCESLVIVVHTIP